MEQLVLPAIVCLLCLGAFTGFLSGLLGVGGGIILVPAFYYGLPLLGLNVESSMHTAIATSMAAVLPTLMMSAWNQHKHRHVDFLLLRRLGPGIFAGAVLGAFAVSHLEGGTLRMIFGGVLFLLALLMIADPARFALWPQMPRQPWPALTMTGIGAVATMMGVGGAAMTVPYMTWCHVKLRTAIGTAAALGVLIALPATAGYLLLDGGDEAAAPFTLGHINLFLLVFVVPAALLVAPAGTRVAKICPVKLLRMIFAGFMVLVSLSMLAGV